MSELSAPKRQLVPWPTVPANNATIVLAAFGPVARAGFSIPDKLNGRRVTAFEVIFHRHNKASAANGLRLYAIDDTDSWRETDLKDDNGVATIGTAAAKQVPALSAPEEYRIMVEVARYRGAALEYTAGADNPEEWNGTIWVHLDSGEIIR